MDRPDGRPIISNTTCVVFGCEATELFARQQCRPHWTEIKTYGYIWPRYPEGGFRAFCIWCGEPFASFYHPLSGRALFCGLKDCQNSYYTWKYWQAPKLWARRCPYCKSTYQARADANYCGSRKCRYERAKANSDVLAKSAARTARWREKHPDAHKEWVKANPKRWSAYQRGREALKAARSIPGHLSEERINQRLSMFAGCWMCGADADTIDHVKPLSKGGWHVLANMRPACRPCNSSKSDTWPFAA